MSTVVIYEVGPRDGLQNEHRVVPAEAKIRFVEKLIDAGLPKIEVTSFVRSGVIPQLSDASEVFAGVEKKPGRVYAALVPNRKGMENGLKADLREAAIFTAASDAFTQKNINCTVDESIERFRDVFAAAEGRDVRVRGYVSTVVECPYAGPIAPERVAEVCKRLLDLGVYEISLGETIGVAVPDEVARLLDAVLKVVPAEKLAGHFHDTRGTALANVSRSLEYGLRTFDSSAGGLGGCPYAPGASGNLATEDLVYMLHRSGYETGVDIKKLVDASGYMREQLNRVPSSRVYQAMMSTV